MADHFQDDVAGLEAIRDALLLSAHVLTGDVSQLGTQLQGRLAGIPLAPVERLLTGSLRDCRHAWLRPLRQSLFGPGSGLLRTLFTGLGETWVRIAVTAGAHRVVVSTADRELVLLDLGREARVLILQRLKDTVPRFLLTSDERQVLSWSTQDTEARIWSVLTGELQHTLEGHESMLSALALSDDGRMAASGSDDGSIRIWDLRSASCAHVLEGHRAPVCAIALTPNGLRALSGSADGALKVWDVNQGRLLHTLEGHDGPVQAIDVAASRQVAVSGADDARLKLWDIDTGELLRTANVLDPVGSVFVSANGRRAISQAQGDQWWTFNLWDLESGDLTRPEGHYDEVLGIALTSGDSRAVSWARDGTIKVWDAETGSLVYTLGEEQEGMPVWHVALDVQGRRLAAAGRGQDVLTVWDLMTGEIVGRVVGHTGQIWGLAIAPDGARCVSVSSGIVRVWDLDRLNSARSVSESSVHARHGDDVVHIGISPDGQRAVTTGDRSIRVWDLATGEEVSTLERWADLRGLVPNGWYMVGVGGEVGRRFAIAEVGAAVSVAAAKEVHEGKVSAVGLAAAKPLRVTAGEDGVLTLWDWAAGRSVAAVRDPEGEVSAVAVTADGSQILSGHVDGTVTLWEVTDATMSRVAGFQARGPIWKASSWDGQSVALVCGRNPRTLQVWSLNPGRWIATFTPDFDLERCAISPGGRTVVAGDASGRCHLLRLVVPSISET